MDFKVFQKLFITLIQILTFFATLKNFENADRNPPQNSLLCGWSIFSSAILSLTASENAQELTCHRRLTVCFTNHAYAASCMQYQCQNHRFSAFEACYCMEEFSKLVSNFKERAKTLSLIFSSTKKQTIVKTIRTCIESIYLL
jgi:hypothetical protein